MEQPYHVTAASSSHSARPRAPCSEPSLLRRSSMEDADSTLTRKRPRLDTGDRGARAMSADRVLASSTSDSQDSSPVQVCFPEARREQNPNQATPVPLTPSRVTINLRSQNPPQQVQAASGPRTPGSHASSPAEADKPTTQTPKKMRDSPLNNSPSPPVELVDVDIVQTDDNVAELSLDDDDADEDINPPINPRDYVMRLSVQGYPPIEVVREMTNHLEKEDQVSPELIQQLVSWLQNQREPFQDRLMDWDILYAQNALLWDAIGGLMTKVMSRRIRYRYEGRRAAELVHTIIPDLIEAYVGLTPRLIQLDIWRLQQSPSDVSEFALYSGRALRVLVQILPLLRGKLWKTLEEHGYAPLGRLHARTCQSFVSASGMMRLTELSAELVRRLSLISTFEPSLLCCLECVEGLMSMAKAASEQPGHMADPWSASIDAAYEYFLALDKEIHITVGGALSNLADNHLKELIDRPGMILGNLIASRMGYATHFFDAILGSSVSCEPRYYPVLIPCIWRIKTLERFISKGRMGQRVVSVELMSDCLVQVYGQYNQTPEGVHSMVLQHIADVLLEEKIINYILSVDSHPQLISRSGNILGFLIVTLRWSPSEMDIAWHAATTSPDPRVHTAIVQMLSSILNLMGIAPLLHTCQKLSELAPEDFTPELLLLFRNVLEYIRLDKENLWESHESRMNPYNLCLTLIKRTDPRKRSSNELDNVFRSASNELTLLSSDFRVTSRESSADERAMLYQECAQDIVDKLPNAAASMHAIYLMITHERPPVLGDIVDNLGLTEAIVEELCSFVDGVRDSTTMECSLKDQMETRFVLLGFLISKKPDSLHSQLYEKFWNYALGVNAINNETRDLVWRNLIEIARKPQPAQGFLEVCIAARIHKLEPEYFTPNLLNFLAEYSARRMRLLLSSNAPDEKLEFPTLDLMWHVVLNALPDTVERDTANLLASTCCTSRLLDDIPLKDIEAAQIQIVRRCLEQLSFAFTWSSKTLDAPVEDNISISGVSNRPEVLYQRCFLVLSELLDHVRRSSRFAPSPVLRPKPFVTVVEPVQGVRMDVSCQVIGAKSAIPATVIHAGDLETRQQFYHRLERWSGSSTFSVIWGGQRVNLLENSNMTLREMGAVCRGNLMLQIRPNKGADTSALTTSRALGCSAIEQEILENFNSIYQFLDANDEMAVTAYKFLAKFSPNSSMRSCIRSESEASEIFPRGRLYKMSYHVACLKAELDEQTSEQTLDAQFVSRSVQLLATAITDNDLMDMTIPSYHTLIALAVETLLAFIEERTIPSLSEQYFSAPQELVSRLMTMIQHFVDFKLTNTLACNAYRLILKASQHSREVWRAFIETSGLVQLHYKLLTYPDEYVRKSILNVVLSACLPRTLESCVDSADVVQFYWQSFRPLVLLAAADRSQSPQLFEALLRVFEDANRSEPDETTLLSYLEQWSAALLAHEHTEFVGRFDKDLVVLGLSQLLTVCVRYLKSFKKALKRFELASKLFDKFLFVAPNVDEFDRLTPPMVSPVLDDKSRMKLYSLVHALCEECIDRQTMLKMNEDQYQPSIENMSWFTDRSKVLRAPTGFVGVRNLGNTCYMNSLITQLFMNVEFRGFLLAANVVDETGQQKLLAHTQELFAFMQNSYHKSADASALAASIRTFDSQEIDTTIQMDVEEFFNLLFDQWEGQMLSAESKQAFRSFYGGNLIQQVKSKECDHVSERDEGFFTIQCEVKGKANLSESLKAYVEGDVMEGGNKYKCESCDGRLVDAVKRTCLKNIPDHLIFHLKRFDWDLMTGSRNKVNDYFEFPDTIDMTPYTIDFLSGDGNSIAEDMFELVGVLVHKGYAEHGHYFSYIRVRPGSDSDLAPWVKFDDSDVTEFDPTELRDCCFGGWDNVKDPRYAEYQDSTMKGHNAYMLFYQRSSTLKAKPEGVMISKFNPAKVSVSEALESANEYGNSVLLRDYGLLSPHHTDFLLALIKDQFRNNGCSQDHKIESDAITVLLHHFCRVVSHTKDLPQYDELLGLITHIAQRCTQCALIIVIHLGQTLGALSDLIVKTPHQKVRHTVGKLIYDITCRLRKDAPQLYGVELLESDDESTIDMPDNCFLLVTVELLRQLMDDIPTYPRAWDDYFDLLLCIASLGYQEVFAIAQAKILHRCLEKLHDWRDEREDLQGNNFLSKLLVRKKPSYNRMIELVILLLQFADLMDGSVQERTWDMADHGKKLFPLTHVEAVLLLSGSPMFSRDRRTVTVANIIQLWQRRQQDEAFLPGVLITLLLKADAGNDLEIAPTLASTIAKVLNEEPLGDLDPWMEAVVVFCEHSSQSMLPHCDRLIKVVMQNTVSAVKAPNESQNSLGHRVFFYKICNVSCNGLDEPECLQSLVISQVKHWGISLLLFEDNDERHQAADLLKLLLFNKAVVASPDVVTELESVRVQAVREVLMQCKNKLQMAFTKEEPRRRYQAILETMRDGRVWLSMLNSSAEPSAQHLKGPADADIVTGLLALENHLENTWQLDDEDAAASEWADSLGTESEDMADYS